MIKLFKKYTRLFIIIGIVLIISNISNLKTIPKKVYDYEVVIHRDKWGVPHIYGSTDEGWMKESFNFSPSTPYAVSRASCDLHLLSFFKAYDFPVVFTRAANVYGPGQQLYRIIPRTICETI